MFRKRRRPTPGYKIPPPFNPIQGENANLRQDGVSPFCAMMQVMEEDTYDDYVICRGCDPRILRFMNNISVAKPFGRRTPGTYQVGEIYPAFLPTQGNANLMDFRQVTYVPPSPSNVLWRVGQNPGVAVGGLDGGQPENLDGQIEILYDHNGKVINWLLIDAPKTGGSVEGPLETAEGGIYVMSVVAASPESSNLVGESVEVIDLSGCIFDEEDADLIGVWVWASWKVSDEAPEGAWVAFNRCCI